LTVTDSQPHFAQPPLTPGSVAVHASCLVVGEKGLLIRGASGSGKSQLALTLLNSAHIRGQFARLVCDDRITLCVSGGRLLATAHPAIVGQMEVRHVGLVFQPFIPTCCLTHVIELVEKEPDRLPESQEMRIELLGVTLPYLKIQSSTHACGTVECFLRQ
jgi:HPr kinase/phosphorylase